MTDFEMVQPRRRTEFHVAILCALNLECDAVEALFDQTWDVGRLGKARGDRNAYSAGRIGHHNVILAFISGMGKARSASVAATLRTSFANVSLALVVGVCGGSPKTLDGRDILLGDVIISNRVIQTDYGRQFSDSLHIRDTAPDGLTQPSRAISSILDKLSDLDTGKKLADKTYQCLQHILEKDGFEEWQYPEFKEDRLYHPQYRHKHQLPVQCVICRECTNESDAVCEDALIATCEQLGCADSMLLHRNNKSRKNHPQIYQGIFASSDQVMKSAMHRDKLREHHKAIGFEMEGAGVWNNLPTIIVKGVCDYADSHKDKRWQKYAAVSAAATAKALLAEWALSDDALTQLQSEVYEASSVFDIPFNPNEVPTILEFIGRDFELTKISQTLSPSQKDQPRSRKIFVAHGLGGIGKTQIAARYAHVNIHQFSAIIWIDGSTLDSTKNSLSNFARRINSELNIKDSNDIDKSIQVVLAWLAQEDNTDWLMIFDNVDLDIDARPPDPQAYRIQDLFPHADHGSILITSRLLSICRMGENLKIAKLSQGESLRLVEQYLGRSLEGDEGAMAVIEILDGLPLALAMAASFIRETAITFKAYNVHYKSAWSELIEQQDEYPLPEYGQQPILTAWRLSYTEIERQSTDAARLLKLLSFFNNKGFSQDLLRTTFELNLPPDLDVGWFSRICESSLSFTKPLRLLLRYSLIEEESGKHKLLIHGVLHEWIHDLIARGPEDDYQSICNLAGHLLAKQVPSNEKEASYWPKMRNLAPHADTFGRRLKAAGRRKEILPDSLYNIGSILQSCAVLSYAEILYLQALQGYEKTFGPEHTLTLATANKLGTLYRDQGKLDSAERMYKRALEGYEEMFGSDHLTTLSTVNELGILYRDQCKLDLAEQMCKRALEVYEKALGSDHISTLDAVNNLGTLYRHQGKLDSAEQMHIRALQGKEKTLGPDHTSTLGTVNNMGTLYRHKGKLDLAEQMCKRALGGYEKVLGLDHLTTLDTVNNLGILYRRQGRFELAEQMHVRVIKGKEKALGSGHISTLAPINNLATLYRDQGRLDLAEQMCMRALQGYERALGPDHTTTLDTVNNLATLYRSRGKLDLAKQMCTRAFQGKEKALGPDHVSTLRTRRDMEVLKWKFLGRLLRNSLSLPKQKLYLEKGGQR